MIAPRFRHVLLLVPALGLAACASGPGGGVRPATVQPISNEAQMGDVIALLNAGDAKGARATLGAMLKRNPRDESAIILLDSITRDPVEILGAQAFDYDVKPGDTMNALAQRYLGSSLKFYALARYNGIDVPASLSAGRTIRIPGVAPRPAPVAPPKPKPAKSRTPEPAAAQKSEPAPKPVAPVSDPARAARLRGAGLAALNKGQVATAVGLLRQASALDPANPLIKRDLERAQRIRQTVKAKR